MEPLGPDIRRELRRFGPAVGMTDLLAAWPEAVGPGIAQNAWPARFARDGTLVVHTADAVWAFELTQRAGEIARRLGRELVPGGLSFVAGPLPEPGAGGDAAAPPPPLEPTAADARRAAEWAAAIEDEELRGLVARAAAASLARAAADRRF